MARIVALSSLVARGHVGLRALTPALESFGHDVIALPTVVLSNHAAYPHVARTLISPAVLDAMGQAIAANGWLGGVDGIITGYLPSTAHVAVAEALVRRVRPPTPAALTSVIPCSATNQKDFTFRKRRPSHQALLAPHRKSGDPQCIRTLLAHRTPCLCIAGPQRLPHRSWALHGARHVRPRCGRLPCDLAPYATGTLTLTSVARGQRSLTALAICWPAFSPARSPAGMTPPGLPLPMPARGWKRFSCRTDGRDLNLARLACPADSAPDGPNRLRGTSNATRHT